jgi:hypothetical protein
VFKILRRRLLCAMGKHELVYCEDIPIVGFHGYRCKHCGFLQSAAGSEKRSQALKAGIVLAILAAAIFAVLLLLASQFVGL